MKKILTLFASLALIVTLISCGKYPDTFAEFNVKKQIEKTNIILEIDIKDPDDEVKGDITVYILDSDDEIVSEKTTTKDKINAKDEEEDDDSSIKFDNLDPSTNYKIEIRTTINEKNIVVYKDSFKTRTSSAVDIKTVEDFLKIKDRRSANYNLLNDLDFKDVDPDDINDGVITIFSGTFNGNGHTIKNYTLESSNINNGLFNQLSGDAKIHDLVLENITIKTKGNVTGSKRMGVLFGNSTSRSVLVENITIKDSKIEANLNGVSNYQEIGMLAGASVAKISNINIDSSNTINVEQKRIGDLKIGGLIGKVDNTSTDDVFVSQIVAEPTINYEANQDDSDGIKNQRTNISIGGLIGQGNNLEIKDVVLNTTINLNESTLHLNELEDKKEAFINFNVAGLLARNVNVHLENVILKSNINIDEIKVVNNLEDEKRSYLLTVNSASIYTRTDILHKSVKNLLLVEFSNNVFDTNDEKTKITTKTLFTRANKIEYGENNKFGVLDGISKDDENIQTLTLEDLFNEDDWVYNQYN